MRNLNILIRDLPKEFEGFSIGLVVDIHTGPSVGKRRVAEIVDVVNEMRPDVIAIAGDLADGFVEYIGTRSKPLQNLRAPYGVYGTVGNHEYFYEKVDNWIKFFKNQLNVTNLINDGVVLRKDGKELCFAGLDDYFAEEADVEGKRCWQHHDANPDSGFRVSTVRALNPEKVLRFRRNILTMREILILIRDYFTKIIRWILGHKMDLEKALARCPVNISTVVMAHQPKGAAYVLTEMQKIGRKVDLILSGNF